MIVKRKDRNRTDKKITCFICIILTVMLITGCANRGGPTEEGGGFPSSCAPADARETTEASENQMILSFINIGKGDAFLLKLPEDGYYLCDTGKAEDYPLISRLLRQKGVDSLKGISCHMGIRIIQEAWRLSWPISPPNAFICRQRILLLMNPSMYLPWPRNTVPGWLPFPAGRHCSLGQQKYRYGFRISYIRKRIIIIPWFCGSVMEKPHFS